MATDNEGNTSTSTKPEWYEENVTSINPDAQRLLERYSKLKPEEVLPHVLKVRDEAFSKFSYPCIGEFRFLSFNLSRMPFYHRILTNLRSNPSLNFLDVGCCVGQEIRFLVNQGIPHKQLHGCDSQIEFVDIGYRLFRDQDTLDDSTFVKGDLLASPEIYRESPLVKTLKGKIDIVFASSLFHLWDYEDQLIAATRLVNLCREKEGVMITGRQVGSLVAGSYSVPSVDEKSKDKEKKQYRHDTETTKAFWAEVEMRTRTKWVVDAGYFSDPGIEQIRRYQCMDDNVQMLWWCATREK